jgi:hypothetical protein
MHTQIHGHTEMHKANKKLKETAKSNWKKNKANLQSFLALSEPNDLTSNSCLHPVFCQGPAAS